MNTLNAKDTLTRLKSLEDVYILIHRSPDGDCIGGGYGLHLLLRSFGIRSRVCCADEIPETYHFLTEDIAFESFEPKQFVAVDVADRGLLGGLNDLYPDCEVVLSIDHHISNTEYALESFWNPDASAACEVIFSLLHENHIPLTEQLARCLYVGIATDTGCFKFSNAGAETFAAIAEIKRQYPNLPYARMNRELFDLKSTGRIRMESQLMQSVQLSDDGMVALLYVPYTWMQKFSVTSEEMDGMPNLPMSIRGVEIGILVKQQEDGSYRVSMRGGEQADVSAVCREFGGGGHIKAGGCSLEASVPAEEACKALIAAAEKSLEKC